MIHYMENNQKTVDAILGNSKARQARVLYCVARDFRDILPASALADLINGATQIINGKDVVSHENIGRGFVIPFDEVENLKKQGCKGQVITVKIVK